jgi:hypothetical protein
MDGEIEGQIGAPAPPIGQFDHAWPLSTRGFIA